jgi:hypothetical protein
VTESESERYLRELRQGLPVFGRRRILAEIRHHLEAALADGKDRGLSDQEAERLVIERLGPAAILVERFTDDLTRGVRGLPNRLVATMAKKRILAVLTVCLGFAVVGAAVFSATETSPSAKPASPLAVTVYFKHQATRSQEGAFAKKLATYPQVKKFKFVTGATALRQMKKVHPTSPGLVLGGHNPFDSFQVTRAVEYTQPAIQKILHDLTVPGVRFVMVHPELVGPSWDLLRKQLARHHESVVLGSSRVFAPGVLRAMDLVTCNDHGLHLQMPVPFQSGQPGRVTFTRTNMVSVTLRVTYEHDGSVRASCGLS